jgi:regulatory protein YycI of two-component signal transduction system YycFG
MIEHDRFTDKFDLSRKVQKAIRKAFKAFVKESNKTGENYSLSKEEKESVVLTFVNTMVEKVLDKNENEQNIKYTDDERNYYKEKIFKILRVARQKQK